MKRLFVILKRKKKANMKKSIQLQGGKKQHVIADCIIFELSYCWNTHINYMMAYPLLCINVATLLSSMQNEPVLN